MQGINVHDRQEWPDAPEGSPALKQLIENERKGVHDRCTDVMRKTPGHEQ